MSPVEEDSSPVIRLRATGWTPCSTRSLLFPPTVYSLSPCLLPASPLLLLPLPLLLKDRMENKAMYLNTVSDRDTGSIFEEPFDGRSLSKLNLCEDGECLRLGPGGEICPGPHTQPGR